jgi:hypothetical protein
VWHYFCFRPSESSAGGAIVSGWKNEDDIKAELRTLTQDLRKLREELRGIVSHPKPDPPRGLPHRQGSPPAEEPVSDASDSTDKRPKKHEKK